MKNSIAKRLTLSLIGLAVAGVLSAQDTPPNFPTERSNPVTCENFGWNADMARENPRIIEACQETVYVEGKTWARLDARFIKVKSDGSVMFSIHDKRDRQIDEVGMEPSPGQVAYINDRPTEFKMLSQTDRINLYVPEGEYGYATQPAPKQRFVRVVPVTPAAPVAEEIKAPRQDVVVADNQARPAMLPKTASWQPLSLLMGGLMLFGALTLTLRRKL